VIHNIAELAYRKDIISEENPMHETVSGFTRKGWSLYECTDKPKTVDDILTICTTKKPERFLHTNQRYLIIPSQLADLDNYKLSEHFCEREYIPNEIPWYIEFNQPGNPKVMIREGKRPSVKAMYPIESLVFNGSLSLVVDKRLFPIFGIPDLLSEYTEPAIEIAYEDIPDALTYCMSRYVSPKQFENNLLKKMDTPTDRIN
jgi:hypothetical protein